MRMPVFCTAVLAYVVIGHPPPAVAQVDQQRAQERMTGEWGALEADKGVLVSTDGRSRRLPAPVRRDDITVDGDGWTVKAKPGWVVREGARRGDYELVRQQP